MIISYSADDIFRYSKHEFLPPGHRLYLSVTSTKILSFIEDIARLDEGQAIMKSTETDGMDQQRDGMSNIPKQKG